jgi:integrase
MPWRKYVPKKGKHGLIYNIFKGITVRKDARGKWILDVNTPDIRKNKTYGTDRESLKKAIKKGEEIAQHPKMQNPFIKEFIDSKNTPSFIECCEEYLQENAGRWSKETYDRYSTILRLHVLPSPCFKKQIGKITRKEIRKHIKKIQRSSNTKEVIHTVIHGVFEQAVDDEIIKANPASGLLKKILPKLKERDLNKPDPFSLQDRDLFLSCAKQICPWGQQLILKVMVFAGLRLGETLAMRHENIDFERKTYEVREGYKCKEFKPPKSGKNRQVDFPDFLCSELHRYIIYQKNKNLKAGKFGGRVDLLFVDPDENKPLPYSQRKIQMLMKRVCKKAGLRIRHPHDLRHTYATILLIAHLSPGYVQKQLGHSSIKITMDVYCHWISGEGRDDLEKVLLGPNKTFSTSADDVPNPRIFTYQKKRASVRH